MSMATKLKHTLPSLLLNMFHLIQRKFISWMIHLPYKSPAVYIKANNHGRPMGIQLTINLSLDILSLFQSNGLNYHVFAFIK